MKLKLLKYFIFLAVIFCLILVSSYFKGVNKPFGKEENKIKFVISKGESVKKIAINLKAEGLISSRLYFEIYAWQKKIESDFKAGNYILSPTMNIKKISEILVKGEVINEEREIKIIEGWNLRDIGQYFEKEGFFISDDFLKMVGYPLTDYRKEKKKEKPKDFSSQFNFLADKPIYYGLEGYVFPDTYRIYKNSSLEDVVLKILSNFDKKLTSQMRADIEAQGKTIYEVITLASVVEKEVRSEKDMKIVAGIFQNRIKNGQPLQSCATLAYILGVNKPIYSIEDTKIDSPYNTYQNYGLPPGPIANPGFNAINAVIYPTNTDYNYFLSKSENGETVFSKTLEEHNLNKAKYLK